MGMMLISLIPKTWMKEALAGLTSKFQHGTKPCPFWLNPTCLITSERQPVVAAEVLPLAVAIKL